MPDSKPTGGDCGQKAGDSSETEHQKLAFFADVILPVRNKAAILQDNCRKLKLQHFTPCYDFNGGVNPDLTMWGILEQQDSNWLHSFFFLFFFRKVYASLQKEVRLRICVGSCKGTFNIRTSSKNWLKWYLYLDYIFYLHFSVFCIFFYLLCL